MGKGKRALAAILEGCLQMLFGAYRASALLVVKAIREGPRHHIPPTDNPILLQSATKLADQIRNRQIKSEVVVKAFINRIKEINPLLNCIVKDRFEEAIEEAVQADAFLATTEKTIQQLETELPFLGIPFTVKECLALKGMPHTAGVLSRQKIIADCDCPVVASMRKAGAIPVAVTNTPEMCCWWETNNPLSGRTNNPYDTTKSSGGSSGGEGAVISAAGSLFGLASDFAGSIRIPAAFNGIFGHRPTSLTSPIEGHYPIPSNDRLKPMLVTGPIARYATDLRSILKIMTKELAPTLDLTGKVDFKDVTVYYMEEANVFLTTPVQASIKAAVRKTAKHFESMGVKTEAIQFKGMRYAMMYWYAMVKTEDGPQVGKELANHNGQVNISTELCKTLVGASKHTLPIIMFGLLEAANGIPYKGSIHNAVLDQFEKFQNEIKEKLGDNNVLILPAHPTTALKHREAVARAMDLGYAAVFNALGFPSTACPVTRDPRGLPVAVQVVANAYQDRLTLAVAEEIERAFGGWTPPYQVQTIGQNEEETVKDNSQ